jgi:hypothetical protein
MWRNGKIIQGRTNPHLAPITRFRDFHLAYEAVQIEDYLLHFRPFKQRSNFSHDFAGCLAIADDPLNAAWHTATM